jgi:hypothetical protein
MEKNEIQQIFGMIKFVIILFACIVFVGGGYFLIERTDWHTLYVMIVLLWIGVVLIAIVGGCLKILFWVENWIEGREKTTKEDLDSVETKNVFEEPKKQSKVAKLKEKMKAPVKLVGVIGTKVTSGGTPEAPPLPIETPIPETKLPIEE